MHLQFHEKMKLPCHHVFFIRKYLCIPLFNDGFIHQRWAMSYYISCFSARFTNESDQVNTYQETHTITAVLFSGDCAHTRAKKLAQMHLKLLNKNKKHNQQFFQGTLLTSLRNPNL